MTAGRWASHWWIWGDFFYVLHVAELTPKRERDRKCVCVCVKREREEVAGGALLTLHQHPASLLLLRFSGASPVEVSVCFKQISAAPKWANSLYEKWGYSRPVHTCAETVAPSAIAMILAFKGCFAPRSCDGPGSQRRWRKRAEERGVPHWWYFQKTWHHPLMGHAATHRLLPNQSLWARTSLYSKPLGKLRLRAARGRKEYLYSPQLPIRFLI